jgi:hypothetical protein
VIEVTTSVKRKGFVAITPARLIVAAAFATALGASVLAFISVGKSDPAGVVMAIYIAVTALAVTPAIIAEIHEQADVTTGEIRQSHANVTLVKASPGEAVVVDETDDLLVIDASGGDLRVMLPDPSTFGNRMLTCERIDRTDHEVVLDPLGRSLRPLDGELRLFVVNGAWQALGD